ncbi:adenylate/guanylate cyclase domain-containing protein [[Mycobacterium] crassicus]|uniref:AAA family ATPase n=1 Tax=[Mycobacterium] crassicus TaxID=2872309 RepID=A0ABU5XFY8_9MYCO|nr:adenylate/guanylate cyclase domain-containing protein [Mycolicibacter sp. MYC098]MEB3021201.1 AAA family ATPase [Mycolicibacter sp. MYC098]
MTACVACATELPANAKFCLECGAAVAAAAPAEFKQVTVLFADVVHSMDLAAAVGAERLREIMVELFQRCAAVVQRYGGTVDKFTGDGVMAVFGAPVALEDHAFRACLAAMDIQGTEERALQLRVGLDSGEVVAGEIGSGPGSYTAIGEHVGMAQRMESVAPPGGVMLSESTARLVDDVVTLGEPELVQIKGAAEPVVTRRLLGVPSGHQQAGRRDASLVGRGWEMAALTGMLDAAIDGSGRVVGIVGPPGIGKSRIVREATAVAAGRAVEVFTAYCESHASEIPFHAVTPLLRMALRVADLDDDGARARIRERVPDADPQDLLLLDDLLGIRDSSVELPDIDPDARHRRLTRLANTVSLARRTPAVYVIEDAHWIDEASESLLAGFLTVIWQTPSLVLVTYRPEYHGALTRIPNSQMVTLAPLNAAQASVLAGELVGSHPSVAHLAAQVVERAAGNPFFAEELVRDLAERGVLAGDRGNYVCDVEGAEASVPATLQATIAARIDRLGAAAKHTLNTAAVIGLRFSAEQLAFFDGESAMAELIEAELIDQVRFTPDIEYAFHHPLIRTVAYESQLKSSRARLHRRLAAAIVQRHPDSLDENAALIAEHHEAAGDLHAAFDWHMRAGTWAQYRDVRAARVSWERARSVADRMAVDDPGRMSMRIAPRTLLCGSTFRVSGTIAATGFDELCELCADAGDKVSLAIGTAGLMTALIFHSRFREAARLASDCADLVEAIGDPTLTVALGIAASNGKWHAGEVVESLRLAQRVIDLADGDPTKGNLVVGSPLALAMALRGANRCCLGIPGWREDLDQAIVTARTVVDAMSYVFTVLMRYFFPIWSGALLPDAAADRDTAEAIEIAEHSGDDFVVDYARLSRIAAFAEEDGSHHATVLALLAEGRDASLRHGYAQKAVRFIDGGLAREKAKAGDVDGAIQLARTAVEYLSDVGEMMSYGADTVVLVESLLQRGTNGDLAEAQAAIDRLAAVPTDPGFVLYEIPLLRLRALMARASGDEDGYHGFVDRYLKRATEVGYEGHIAQARAMT